MSVEIAKLVRTDTGLATSLAMSVSRLSRRLRQERGSTLTATQLSVLGTLRRHGSLTAGAIAAIEKVQPPSMTRTLGCLVDLGLVGREPDPTDGRQIVIHLSEEGEHTLAAERKRRDRWLATRLRELDHADRDVLRSAAVVLDRLAQE
ncbi:MAG: MarR family winged helix-turn-helix transcriptional regulator [Nocardioidaceae bacterium]